MATLKENVIVFSTGKKIKISSGTLAINCFLEVSHGYGSPILRYDSDCQRDPEVDPVYNANDLTVTEALELADCAINNWMQLKENIRREGLTSQRIFLRSSQ